jgi:signal transduction histidine kinase
VTFGPWKQLFQPAHWSGAIEECVMTRAGEPWFKKQPRVAVAVAVVLFTGVFVLRLVVPGPSTVVTALYVLPVALLATAFGLRAGVAAGLVAVGLLGVWVAAADVDLTAIGWVSRILPLLLVGALVGNASDELARAAGERRRHAVAEQRHRQAVEINDTLIQGMAAAKWAFEGGRTQAGLGTLTATIELGHQLVSELIREAEMGPTHGT